MTAPARSHPIPTTDLPNRRTATTGRSATQLVTTDLRTALPAAVLARPADDGVQLTSWVLVARTLEATAHALECADGAAPWVVLTAMRTIAQHTAERVCVDLGTCHGARETVLRGSRLEVERSWLRLAGMLLGPALPDAAPLVRAAVAHRDALAAWAQLD